MNIKVYSPDAEFLTVTAHGHNDAGFVQYHSTGRYNRKNHSTTVSILTKFCQLDATVDRISDWNVTNRSGE